MFIWLWLRVTCKNINEGSEKRCVFHIPPHLCNYYLLIDLREVRVSQAPIL